MPIARILVRSGLLTVALMSAVATARAAAQLCGRPCDSNAWRNLLEQFQPLSTQVVFKHHKAGSIAVLDVAGRVPKLVNEIWPIRDQSAGGRQVRPLWPAPTMMA
jgi:hypothetical protein